jgi:hypothetical protein
MAYSLICDARGQGSFSFNGKDMQLIKYRENIGSIKEIQSTGDTNSREKGK